MITLLMNQISTQAASTKIPSPGDFLYKMMAQLQHFWEIFQNNLI